MKPLLVCGLTIASLFLCCPLHAASANRDQAPLAVPVRTFLLRDGSLRVNRRLEPAELESAVSRQAAALGNDAFAQECHEMRPTLSVVCDDGTIPYKLRPVLV